jgi:spermidine synthase
MARPWTTLASVDTLEGMLELRQRGDSDFLIMIDGRVLMNSFSRSSEEELSRLTLAAAPPTKTPRVLVGGLGMAFTLRTALDALPPTAKITVAELNPIILDWCRGALGPATNRAADDPRVTVSIGDVAELIGKSAPSAFDAIILDLYEGPNDASQGVTDPFYSAKALARTRAALVAGGALGVWSEDADAPFAKRFAAAGFSVTTHKIGSGGRRHVVYVGKR